MEEKAPDVPEASAPQGDPKRLTYVLLVVAIIVGISKLTSRPGQTDDGEGEP